MTSPWPGRRVCVAGLGVSGIAAARVLLDLGSHVVVVDARDREHERQVADELRARGAEVRLGDGETPVDADLVVTSPGWRPDQPLLVAAARQGIEVIGEPELAFRLRPVREGHSVPWVGVTGTNGKTTTVGMVAEILRAAGYRTIAAGNVGTPLLDVVLADPAYEVIAVELSSFQLHWMPTATTHAAVVLNIAEDHLDWHGSMDAYAADKARIWRGNGCGVYNRDDARVTALALDLLDDPHPFTDSEPSFGGFGVIDRLIVDRCAGWSPNEPTPLEAPGGGIVLATFDDLTVDGPHNVANAVAAAAVARVGGLSAIDVPVAAVAAGLRAYRPGAHRNALVATVDDVAYVNDSKATNPHAAAASLAAYDSVVWIAGGLLKGASVDAVVAEHASRLRGVVLIGRDRKEFAEALARHAPDVPVIDVGGTDTEAMTSAVAAARDLAVAGDTVLLAPAAASMDMFTDYAARGDAFAAAVRDLAGDR